MEPAGSLPYLQVPATCPCPEPDQPSPCHSHRTSTTQPLCKKLITVEFVKQSNVQAC